MEAPGEPDDPHWRELVDAKAEAYADEALFAPVGPLPA